MVTILVNNEFQAEMSWDSLDFASLSVYTVGTALTMVLVYYGLKTLKLFKGNVAARAWTYISLSAVLWSRCGHVPRRFTRTYGPVGRRGSDADCRGPLLVSWTKEELSVLGE